jgi:predicted kinase
VTVIAESEARPRELTIPQLCLVVLIGVSGSGKSTFASAHFKSTEVLSSDFCRGLVSDDENDQAASRDAFDVLHYIAGKRLAAGRPTVIDATNVQPASRKQLVDLARAHDVLPVAIVLDMPEKLCAERNETRPDRTFGAHVLRRQGSDLRRGLRGLQREGFRTVHVLRTPEEGFCLVTWSTAGLTPLACCGSRWGWLQLAMPSSSRGITRASCCARCVVAMCRSRTGSQSHSNSWRLSQRSSGRLSKISLMGWSRITFSTRGVLSFRMPG